VSPVVFESLRRKFLCNRQSVGAITSATIILGSGILPLIVFYLLIADASVLITPDSTEYIAFAKGILSGDYSFLNTTAGFRTPGYPLLISMTELILGADLQNVIYLHLFATIVVGVFCVIFLRRLINPIFVVGIYVFSILLFLPLFFAILTEWVLGCLLIATYVLVVSYFRRPNLYIFGAISFLISFGILCRPPMIAALAVPLSLIVFNFKDRFLKKSLILFLCLMIPSSWAAFNFYKEGVFALSPRVGFWRLAQAGLLSGFSESHTGYEFKDDTKVFLQKFEAQRHALMDFNGQERQLERAFNNNYAAALDVSTDMGLSWAEGDRLAAELAAPVIQTNLKEYLILIVNDFKSQFSFAGWYLWAVCLLALGISLKSVKDAALETVGLYYSLYLAWLVHLVHTGSAVFYVPMLSRLFWLTFTPVFFLSALIISLSIKFVRPAPCNSIADN
jgi:hypothetical protein